MTLQYEAILSTMILSHSGWRGVFDAEGEEGKTGEISVSHKLIVAGAAAVFAEYLYIQQDVALSEAGSPGLHSDATPLVLIGTDTRPTGKIIAEIMIAVLLNLGCEVRYAGVVTAPEIMAWARSSDGWPDAAGFIYVSASHNPIGHNGFKFGFTDGGVLSTEEATKLTKNFRIFMSHLTSLACLEQIIFNTDSAESAPSLSLPMTIQAAKKEAWDAYYAFSGEVAWGTDAKLPAALKSGIASHPLGVCCDYNGSARCVSIDTNFFEDLGIQFKSINAKPGEIAHRIVPEGEALEPCRIFLEKSHGADPAFVMGYVPDCDGDRGNLVIQDGSKAHALEAQEVFALACVAELAQLAWTGEAQGKKIAVAVNDPTSLRIDRIAAAFGASVFRAEVGEANVVGLARKLRKEGYTVRILGEGSAGGNITHPSAVRDPLHTVLALTKILSLRSENGKPGLFELWCNASGQAQRYRPDFTLADIISSLPPFVTTPAYSPEAVLKITGTDQGELKGRYQRVFLREWEERKDQLKTRYGIYSWEAAIYNGIEERKGIADFAEAGKGGLKICFFNIDGSAIASIWMRGSATEPVLRILAEAEGTDWHIERDLIEWQRRMITGA